MSYMYVILWKNYEMIKNIFIPSFLEFLSHAISQCNTRKLGKFDY